MIETQINIFICFYKRYFVLFSVVHRIRLFLGRITPKVAIQFRNNFYNERIYAAALMSRCWRSSRHS